MKNYTLIIIAILLISCSKETTNLSDNSPKEIHSLTELFTNKSFKTNYRTKNQVSGNKRQSPGELFKKYTMKLSDKKNTTDWKIISDSVKKDILTISKAKSKDEITQDVQYVSLRIINEYLLPLNGNEAKVDYLKFFLKTLVEHKAGDVDVLADGLVALKPFISTDTYNRYKQHIINSIEMDRKFIRENFAELYESYQNSKTQEEASVLLMEGRHFSNKLEEAKYAEKVLNLNARD